MALGNKLLDKEFANTGPTPEMGARRLVQMSKQILNTQQQYLENVRKIVAKHGKAKLAAELGADEAAALITLYGKVSKCVTDSAPNINVANME
jgi:hypothetical protein